MYPLHCVFRSLLFSGSTSWSSAFAEHQINQSVDFRSSSIMNEVYPIALHSENFDTIEGIVDSIYPSNVDF